MGEGEENASSHQESHIAGDDAQRTNDLRRLVAEFHHNPQNRQCCSAAQHENHCLRIAEVIDRAAIQNIDHCHDDEVENIAADNVVCGGTAFLALLPE